MKLWQVLQLRTPPGTLLIEGQPQLLYSVCCSRGKCIKIQSNCECLQARHSCKAQGEMRAKPEMKPWVHTDKSRMSSAGAALRGRAFAFVQSSAAPKGAQLNILTQIPQGLRPGLCRSVALTGLIQVFSNNQFLGCFDAVALGSRNYLPSIRAYKQLYCSYLMRLYTKQAHQNSEQLNFSLTSAFRHATPAKPRVK